MPLNTYLHYANGRCAEAFACYEGLLAGRITERLTYGQSPMADQTPPELRERIMHMRLELPGGAVLMGSDAPPQFAAPMQGFSVALTVAAAEEAERVFAGLAADGTVHVPLHETFWASRFGMLIDAFGVPWLINCNREA